MAIPERVTRLEAQREHDRQDIEGLKRTAYGKDGTQGVVGDLRDHLGSYKPTVQALAEASDQQGRILVGNGDGGLVETVRVLRVQVRLLWAAAGLLLAAYLADLVRSG